MTQEPEFRHLTSFVMIAEELNFGKAAVRLHITQPALSAHIKQLEDWHGQRLFKRVPSGAELTEAGRKFLVWARQILHLRGDAMKSASRKHSAAGRTLRLGFSPFANHILVHEAMKGYREIVPDGRVNSSSDCTAPLMDMLEDGRLDAAIVTLPIFESDMFEHRVCEDRLLICLRKDDPLSKGDEVPRKAVAERLRIMFHRNCHPLFHDQIFKRFKTVGIKLRPTETFSAPSEMQFLVKTWDSFGLITEGMPLDPELTALPIEGMSLRVRTGLVFGSDRLTPVLPMLAHRMFQRHAEMSLLYRKKPSGRVTDQGSLNLQIPC